MNKSIKCLGAKILNQLGIVGWYSARQKSVKILMYHRINNEPDCLGLTIHPQLFSQQLKYLKAHYKMVTLAEAVDMISHGVILDDCCVITFDDGYRDNYEIAAPLLAEQGVPATIFVTYDAIEFGHFGWGVFDRALLTATSGELDLGRWELGRYALTDRAAREKTVITLHRLLKKLPDAVKQEVVAHVVTIYGAESAAERTMMTWDEVNELAAGDLISIGAHTITHPILSRISDEQARQEIVEGKRLLEQKIGRTADFFAYPNGGREDISPQSIALVQGAGYRAACTTIFGIKVPGSNPFELARIDVTSSISTDSRNKFSPDVFAFALSGIFHRS